MSVPQSAARAGASQRGSRLAGAMLGDRAVRRMTIAHGLDDLADGLLNLSLVGSLFFSVSLEASRSRILLYLLLTAAPLAVATPLIGPLVERVRAGYRKIIVGTQIARAVLALLLIGSLLSLAFYPIVFSVLLARKVYAIARTAVLGQLVDDPVRLVAASGHLARVGTVAGGIGTALGGLLLVIAGPEQLVAAAAVGYLGASLSALRLPIAEPVPVADGVVLDDRVVDAEVRVATLPVATTRAAAGAITFLLAYALKQGGGDAWLYASGLVAGGVGGFVGTLVSPRLHRLLTEQQVLALALLLPGLVAVAGALTIGSASIVSIAFAMGAGASVASRMIDALYGRVPVLRRARVIARSELRFQLSNVVGATVPVLLPMPTRLGFGLVAVVLLGAGFVFGARQRISLRDEAGRLLLTRRRGVQTSVARALLRQADQHVRAGAGRMGVLLAEAAVRVAVDRAALEPQAPPDDELELAQQAWSAALADAGPAALADAEPPTIIVRNVVLAAVAMVDALEGPISPA